MPASGDTSAWRFPSGSFEAIVIVNGLRRHREPRTAVRDVQPTIRLVAQPLEVTFANGRRIAAYGCAGMAYRERPGPEALARAKRPYHDLAAALRHWAATGHLPE